MTDERPEGGGSDSPRCYRLALNASVRMPAVDIYSNAQHELVLKASCLI